MTDPAGRTRTPVSLARRVIVAVIVVSFSAAAISGIVVLLGAELGPTAWRVLSTTSIVGAFSVAVLCCVSLVGRRLQTFGYIGAGVSVVAAVLAYHRPRVADVPWLWDERWEIFWDSLWTAVAASIGFSFASLLLLLADRRRTAIRVGLIVTLALFAIVFVMVIFPVWTDEYGGEYYSRVLGIVSILAALGAIVLPVLSLLLRERPDRGDGEDRRRIAVAGVARTAASGGRTARRHARRAGGLAGATRVASTPLPRMTRRRRINRHRRIDRRHRRTSRRPRNARRPHRPPVIASRRARAGPHGRRRSDLRLPEPVGRPRVRGRVLGVAAGDARRVRRPDPRARRLTRRSAHPGHRDEVRLEADRRGDRGRVGGDRPCARQQLVRVHHPLHRLRRRRRSSV